MRASAVGVTFELYLGRFPNHRGFVAAQSWSSGKINCSLETLSHSVVPLDPSSDM